MRRMTCMRRFLRLCSLRRISCNLRIGISSSIVFITDNPQGQNEFLDQNRMPLIQIPSHRTLHGTTLRENRYGDSSEDAVKSKHKTTSYGSGRPDRTMFSTGYKNVPSSIPAIHLSLRKKPFKNSVTRRKMKCGG